MLNPWRPGSGCWFGMLGLVGPVSMPNRHRILIVDDDPGLREQLTEQLSLHEEFEVLALNILGDDDERL
jgi:hypothetical protein